MICPKCKGEKKVDLFTSSNPCGVCKGTSEIGSTTSKPAIELGPQPSINDPKVEHTFLIQENRVDLVGPVKIHGDVSYGPGKYRIEICKNPMLRYQELKGKKCSVANYA